MMKSNNELHTKMINVKHIDSMLYYHMNCKPKVHQFEQDDQILYTQDFIIRKKTKKRDH